MVETGEGAMVGIVGAVVGAAAGTVKLRCSESFVTAGHFVAFSFVLDKPSR